MVQLTDTSVEADRVFTEIYRQMPMERKWRLLGEAFQTAKVLHAAGYRSGHPGAGEAEIHLDWMQNLYGVTVEITGTPAMLHPLQNMEVLREVIRALEKLGIIYALGGSMASSIHGIARFTQDADLTVEPFPGKEKQLAACFGTDYYLSITAMEDAINHRSTFNILNIRKGFKVDFFVRKETEFEQSALQRRMAMTMADAPAELVFVQSPEDVILFKLRWYRLGNEVSDQQWRDVVGLLKVKAGLLDESYLDPWAANLNLTDLLNRARQESSSG